MRFLFLLLPLALISCSGVRDGLGLDKEADGPDEFYVIKRAPLEVPPPSYTKLAEPRPGAPRPQEKSPQDMARSALLGQQEQTKPVYLAEPTQGTTALLKEANALQAEPDIRAKVNAETLELKDRNKPVARRLLNTVVDSGEISASVVDAPKEAARIKENMEKGRPITEGATPSIEE